MLVKARSDWEPIDRTALKDAASYAEAYEHFVARSISQIDQITMQLKYSWEHSAQLMKLEDLRREGMFTDPVFVSVAIYDSRGIKTTSTGEHSAPTAIRKDAAFAFHENNNSTALRMDMLVVTKADRRSSFPGALKRPTRVLLASSSWSSGRTTSCRSTIPRCWEERACS